MYWGTEVKDEPVRPVWRRLMCHCGGEFRHSETLTERYNKIEVHYCDKCHERREFDEVFPRVVHLPQE